MEQILFSMLKGRFLGPAATFISNPKESDVTGKFFRAAVLGMGSLGSAQLSATSDLDIIVIYQPDGVENSDGRRPLATRMYYARLTQAFITSLTAQTAETSSDFDPTLPGPPPALGNTHPITKTISHFRDLMGRFGFTVVEGPEIEDELHNFDALNIPEDHPARDPLDNFYIATARATAGGPILLRSQTSTVQIRTMESVKPPVRIVSLGRVYRPDTMDATHSCMFHQMEGLMVDTNVTMAQLKTVLSLFARSFLGPDVEIRFRPSFFPFTEPSVEVDMKWGDSWMEIGGAGMVDPNVFKAVGYDPEVVSGFAFGLGIERFCMKHFEVDDIRRFYENDVRFLKQF